MASPVLVDALSSTEKLVRGESCNVLGYHIFNPSNAVAYVQFFDTLAAPTVGTTVPKWSIGVPTLGEAFIDFAPAGLFFKAGLWVAATTTATGASAPSAGVNVNLAMS
jgi:hypothetical protein